jgi:hypothetical protein
MAFYQSYIGIDYSGAKTPISRNRRLQVFKATPDCDPRRVKSPAGKRLNWTRKEIGYWCLEQLKDGNPVIIGIDHGFSFPMSYMERYQISNWDQFLEDFQQHWPTDQDDSTVESFRRSNIPTGKPTEFRLTEKWTTSAKSVFRFDINGQVAKSTHAGIPWLRYIRRNADPTNRPHFWPFDGFEITPQKSVIVEIFPSLFRKRYPKRYKTPDEHDAMCVAQWLKDMDTQGHLSTYFNPPLTDEECEIARLEGWILGVY